MSQKNHRPATFISQGLSKLQRVEQAASEPQATLPLHIQLLLGVDYDS